MSKTHGLPAVVLIILTSRVLTAQVATGTPPFSSLGGGPFDTVNVGNLNVHFAIPVVHKAGRGMNFTYDLSYDSSIWTPVTSSGVTQWQPQSNWGWRGATEVATGYLSWGTGKIRCLVNGQWVWESSTRNYVYHDAWGAQHPFPGVETNFPTCGSSNHSGTASDGSGYTINNTTITTRGGQRFSPPLNTQTGAGTATDANGNQIGVNGSGVFTDTLGTTALTVSGSGTPISPMTFQYTSPSGAQSYTINYTQYTVQTAFGFGTTIQEYGPISVPLVTSVSLPDGSKYSFTYESGPSSCVLQSGTTKCVTARITSVQVSTGGTITYSYSGGTNSTGMYSDGSTAGLTRVLSPATSCSSGGCWQYARALVTGTPGPGSTWKTTVTDPPGNQTVINFAEDSTTTATYNFYETERQVYEGTQSSGTLLSTTIECYNGTTPPSTCEIATVGSPITRTTVFRYLPDSSGLQAETDTIVDQFGLTDEVDDYDYAVGAVGPLIRKTITSYAALGNGIADRPSSVTIKDINNNIKASTSYGFDETTPTPTSGTPQHISVTGSRGLLTSVVAKANGTTNLYRTYTYFDTGNLKTSTDVSTSSTTNGATTTYNYASGTSCGNSFVTSITEPLSLSRSMTWDCNGGVMLSLIDENGKTSSTAYTGTNYTNVFWRPYSTTDQAGTVTDYFYNLNTHNPPQPFQTESKYHTAFNGGASTVDVLNTRDGFGRAIFRQTKQGPTVSNYDTVATCYDSAGRVSLTTMPYSTTAIASGASCPSSNPGNSTSYDALGRVIGTTNTGGGSTAFVYSKNDVLQTVSSPSLSKQQEFDALGRLTSVCEVTGGTTLWPSGPCGQKTSATGYLTKYTYDLLGDRTSVVQNAQGTPTQTRTYNYDMLGRMTSEANPETKGVSVTYSYDSLSSDASCGTITSAGNLLKRLDAASIAACYSGYDALHRLGATIYPSTSTPATHFVYDSATVNGSAIANAKTRLAEAYTCIGTCTSKTTDMGFSYSATGLQTDLYESTPNSGGYYHLSKSYYPNGITQTFSGVPSIGLITYGVDGEGRWNTVSASTGQNPVTQTSYNPAGQVTSVTFGSADSDAYQYDSNTGRMSQYTFTVNGSSVIGKVTWNTNGSLGQFQVTQDPFNAANVQTCDYGYDDLARVTSVSCNNGSTWGQNFTYDVFGNVKKTVPTGATGIGFNPTYDTTSNRYSSLCVNLSYDSSGNLKNDCFHSYTWDATGHPAVVDGNIQNTFDALGNLVEENEPGFLGQTIHDFDGSMLGDAHGQSGGLEWIPLPGGGVASYSGGVLQNYNHADWLRTTRFSSTPSRTLTSDWAVAPYGEHYVTTGPGPNAVNLFTGIGQSIANDLYDTQSREYHSTQGRWITPDPAGIAGVNPSDPQSWNRYAYVGNHPLNHVDPTGTVMLPCDDWDCGGGAGAAAIQSSGAHATPSILFAIRVEEVEAVGEGEAEVEVVGAAVRQPRLSAQAASGRAMKPRVCLRG